MSARIAPYLASTGTSLLGDRPLHADRDARNLYLVRPRPAESPSQDESADSPPSAHETETPVLETGGLPAEMLFTAALLANTLPPRPASLNEIRLRTSQEWAPPDSSLTLRDKTI